MKEIAVELAGVQKSFGDKRIYESLDLAVRRGETLTVLGADFLLTKLMLSV